MSGKNFSALVLPPGIFSDSTQYGTGKHWFDGNLVRWLGNMLVPVGGWRSIANFGAAPILNAQVPPAANNGNVIGPGAYTFAAQPLGANVGKRVILGVFMRFSVVPVHPVITVAGVSCTIIQPISAIASYAMLLVSDAVISAASGDIVVNVPSGSTVTSCKVYQYEYIGPDPINGVGANGSPVTTVSTPIFNIPLKSIGLAIGTLFNFNDPIVWDWPGSAVDNSEATAEQSTSMARLASVGLNTVSEIITQGGAQSGDRRIRSALMPEVVGFEPIRDMVSWRDNVKSPWMAAGSSDKLWGLSVNSDDTYTPYNITPSTLAWNPGGIVGYGSGAFGEGPYGSDNESADVIPDRNAQWSLDSFGKLLIAVHSQDGRLFTWDPTTPATIAAPVVQAPVDNTLCIMSNEEFLFVLGGKNNPRRVKWASQRTSTDWTPTATNSAGGFDLQSHGVIKAAIKVPEGILVLTGADVHLIQYIGAPNYYGRRKISDEGSIVGKNCLVAIPNGAMWMGNSDFWIYVGGNAVKLPCTVHTDAFYRSELSEPSHVFLGVNEFAGEVWCFFPLVGGTTPTNYVSYQYAQGSYWSKGTLERTAWLNPVWQAKPLAAVDQTLYEQEFGSLADGVSRNGTIFAETGGLELGEGDEVARADRIYQDAGVQQPSQRVVSDPLAFTATFKLRQAPNAPERLYGPVALGDPKGYTTIRFRARQMSIRIDQTKDEIWTLGKLRLRLKPGGKR